MASISDLSWDLVEEILSRVPMTSVRAVRSTCKRWNVISKDPSFTKKYCGKAAEAILVILLNDSRACLMSVNLHGIRNNEDLFDPSIKKICKSFNQVFHCHGLLVCATKGSTSLRVWNPYLGQTRWIKPINYHRFERYALGYDNNRDHKILRLLLRILNHYDSNYVEQRIFEYQIFDPKCNIWKVSHVTPDWCIPNYSWWGVSVKGNTYFVAQERMGGEMTSFLLCFDFTKESFGPHLHLPFDSRPGDVAILSSVREEKLAVLCKRWNIASEMKIWITTKIESHAVSWSYFLKLDRSIFYGSLRNKDVSFFVDEKKKVTVIYRQHRTNFTAYVIGEDGYYKVVDLGESTSWPFVFSYVPSWVQIQ